MNKKQSRPWDEYVSRVVIHIPHYLSFSGEETAGGRQRKTRDIAELIRYRWGRDCLIVQKGEREFETQDSVGTAVVGVKVPLNKYGDPAFGLATRRILRDDDAVLTLGQEDAWPFFIRGAKAIHTGVWWDYPHPALQLWLNRHRTLGLIEASRSVWSVDTNLINWVRGQGRRGFDLVKKIEYRPNFVDLRKLEFPQERAAPSDPLRILFARRYEDKRGGTLLLDALSILKARGFRFEAVFSLGIGQDGTDRVHGDIACRGLTAHVEVRENSMDEVFAEYAGADVAVIPTIWSEGTSYSCIEAIAAGVPPIVTPVGGLANLVVPHFNGLVATPTPESLASSIEQAAEPATWRRMHKNCLSMREVFSKDAWDERFLEWLKD